MFLTARFFRRLYPGLREQLEQACKMASCLLKRHSKKEDAMSDAQTDKLIRGLEDFRTRSDCIKKLGMRGNKAVGPLVEALDSTFSEGARWAVIKCLGLIQDKRAIPALAPLLKEGNMADEAREALTLIAGKDLGAAPQTWLEFFKEEAGKYPGKRGPAPDMRSTGLDEKQLLELIFDADDIQYKSTGSGKYLADVPTSEDGTQQVRVHFSEKDHEGEPIVIVYSICCAADPSNYDYALRRNLKMPYGALAVADSSSGPQFVMFNTLLRQDMSASELKKSIMTVAERAAVVKKDLSEEHRA